MKGLRSVHASLVHSLSRLDSVLRKLPRSWVFTVLSTAVALLALLIVYRLVDPLPPRRFAIAAAIAGTTYDTFSRQYARVLARYGVQLEVRNYPSGVEHFDALRDATSGVQAAVTTFGFTLPDDAKILSSLGGITDLPVFVFYRSAGPVTQFAQFRGKRISIGMPGTALRALMSDVLSATNALDASTSLVNLGYAESVDALIAGAIDMAVVPLQLDEPLLRRALGARELRLMNVSQAEAISKAVPGFKHVVLSRGLISLSRDIPDWDVNLLSIRTRVLVRNDLHPALQYLLLEAMREIHWAPGPLNHLGEFPAEQPNDLPLSPTAEAYYRSGPTFWQRYTSFWLTSLLNRVAFFVIPIVVMLIPLIGLAPRVDRWLHLRRIDRLHRALGDVQRELDQDSGASQWGSSASRIAEIGSALRSLKVARRFDAELQSLRIHLRMAREDLDRARRPDANAGPPPL